MDEKRRNKLNKLTQILQKVMLGKNKMGVNLS